MHELRKVHWSGALQVIVYVKRASGKGLVYRRSGHLRVETYSDSGYTGDRGDKKSTLGFCT